MELKLCLVFICYFEYLNTAFFTPFTRATQFRNGYCCLDQSFYIKVSNNIMNGIQCIPIKPTSTVFILMFAIFCLVCLQCHWNLGMDKLFYPTLYNGYNYLSILGLKLTHVGLRATGIVPIWLHPTKYPQLQTESLQRIWSPGKIVAGPCVYLQINSLRPSEA